MHAANVTTAALPLQQLGATYLVGLHADFVVPSFATAPTPAVAAETGLVTAGTASTAAISFVAKRIGTRFVLSREALQQSGAGDLIMRQVVLKTMELAERQMLMGAGTGSELTGLANVSGVNAVVGGTDGALLTFQHPLDLERSASVGTDGASGFVINPLTRSFLRKTARGTGLPAIFADDERPLLGHRVACTTLCPSDLEKGSSGAVCSALFYGQDWSEYLVGIFGSGVDVSIDNYSGAAQGLAYINAALYIDAHPLRPTGFSKMVDAKLS